MHNFNQWLTTSNGRFKKRLPFVLIAGVYILVSFALFDAFKLTQMADTRAYQEAAELSFFSLDFWRHWRAATFVIPLKMFGDNFEHIALFQWAVYTASWLFFASVMVRYMEKIRLTAFTGLLLFSLGTDFFVWNKVIMAESLDLSLIVLIIASLMLLQERIGKAKPLGWPQQMGAGGLLAVVLFLWVFSRAPNYLDALLMALSIIVIALIWRLRTWWPILSVIVLTLFASSYLRSAIVEYNDTWQLSMMNAIAANILPDEEKMAFFVERGLPHGPEALKFRGYVPARYAGDWESVFKEWIETKGRRTFIEYSLLTAPDRIQETAEKWEWVVNPELLVDLYGRSPRQDFPSWLRNYAHLLYSPGGIPFLLLSLWALATAMPRIYRRNVDWRWLIPLLFMLLTLPLAYLKLTIDRYEARHLLSSSFKIRLGILLIVLFVADYTWVHRPRHTFKIAAFASLAVLIAWELLAGYHWTRDRIVYPGAAAVAPETNLLVYRDIEEDAYQVYQYVGLDSRVLKLQLDKIDGSVYRRAFMMQWGLHGEHPELITWRESELSLTWRNTPQLISVAGPQGPVYGPYPVDEERQSDYYTWEVRRLPGLLESWQIQYVYIEADAWSALAEYERQIFQNPALYKKLHQWDNGDRIYRAASDIENWAALAAPVTAEPLLPEEALIFNPATGEIANHSTILENMRGIMHATGLPEELRRLYGVLQQMHFQDELPEGMQEAVTEWRAAKSAGALQGVDYLVFSETWFQWLPQEEKALFEQGNGYELVTQWKAHTPENYYLYAVNP